jgi:hypothetical protein
MQVYRLDIFCGLVSSIFAFYSFPVKASNIIFQEVSGQDSSVLDRSGLDALSNIGLNFSRVESTATPVREPGFDYNIGFAILPPSSDSSVRGTTYTFMYDKATEQTIPLFGKEEFSGHLLFDVDTSKLNIPDRYLNEQNQLDLGNFSINVSFDSTNLQPTIFLTNIIGNNLPLLNIIPFTNLMVDLEDRSLYFRFEATITQQFSDFLMDAGATESVAGVKVLEGRGDRNFIEVSPENIPESNSVLTLFFAAGSAFFLTKDKKI